MTDKDNIAIVGIGCRFPGRSDNADALWKMLMQGTDAVTEVIPERWSAEQFFHPQRGMIGKSVTRWAGQIDDIDRFDCHFFGISPREASLMDPQQRMLLEVCWEALEDAGQIPARWRDGRVGVYVGGFTLDYMLLQLGSMDLRGVEPHTATGSMMTLLANRLSYVYGFVGPSMTIDTACSSSLVAIHQACVGLRSGECDMTIAGGVNALLTPSYTVAESRAGMLSPTGRSRAFDASADGYVRGEGAGLVVLKRLDRARADGDRIYALIRSTATNHDGQSEGLTVPSGDAQMKLMRQALKDAGVAPSQISYVEAHGTGTPVGDPIEARAIGSVLREGRQGMADCLMGSIKTNIGHTEAAAGVAGLIKAALVMHHRQVPPHLHVRETNPAISLKELQLEVPKNARSLSSRGELFSCVNSFGFGGANAHAVLSTVDASIDGHGESSRSNPEDDDRSSTGYRRRWMLPISAGDEGSLRDMAMDMAEYLSRAVSDGVLTDVCYTAALRRQHLGWRLCVHGRDAGELVDALRMFGGDLAADKGASFFEYARLNEHENPGIVFVYSGMGPQWPGMGKQLYRENRVFSVAMDEVLDIFDAQGIPLRARWLEGNDADIMAETEVAQPANFVIQVAITKLLEHHGIRPSVCVGHSAGEPAAAWAAGVFSLEDAARISWARSHLQQQTSGQGGMLAVGMDETRVLTELQALNDSSVSLAAVNSPHSVTLAGNEATLDHLRERLERDGHFVRKLKVKVPYHSAYMDPLREPLIQELSDIEPESANIPLYSTVTGSRIDGRELNAEYWWKNVRQPVRFERAVRQILNEVSAVSDWIEIGPHPVLAQSIRETAADEKVEEVRCRASLHRKHAESESLARLLASLYVNGHDLDWHATNRRGQLVSLPRRRWQDIRLWYEMPESKQRRTSGPDSPLLARRMNVSQPVWELDLLAPRLAWLRDHRVGGGQVLPGAVYIEAALEAAQCMYGDSDIVSVDEVKFERALYWLENERRTVQLSIDGNTHGFVVASRILDDENARWEQHCTGKLCFSRGDAVRLDPLSAVLARCIRKEDGIECYERLYRIGLEYGLRFQGIVEALHGDGEVLTRLVLPSPADEQLHDHVMHPVLLDLCLQTIAVAIPVNDDEPSVYMPVGIDHVHRFSSISSNALLAHARINRQVDGTDGNGILADVTLYQDDGTIVARIEGCRVVALDTNGASPLMPQRLYQIEWSRQALADDRTEEDAPDAAPGTWLLCGPMSGLAKALVERFALKGHSTKFVVHDEDGVSRAALNEQIADIGVEALRGVVYFAAANAMEGGIEGLRELVSGALHCVQALISQNAHGSSNRHARLWLVTRSSQKVGTYPVLRPAGGSLWGLGRVFGHAEQASHWGGMIDLDETASDTEDARRIVDECLSESAHDETAWRAGDRHVSCLVTRDEALDAMDEPAMRSDCTYLITGGLGGLGLTSAMWLVDRGARHLLLLGRTPLPDREQWRDPGLSERQRRMVRAVQTLEARGARVRVENVDISHHDALAEVVARHERQAEPSIRGVIHSAGATDDHLLDDIDDDQFYGVFKSKVIGAWNLHDALLDTPLDFFVSYSSATSCLASSGQGNYASANACLDALMAWRHDRGLPGLAIGWGPWREAGLVRSLDLTSFFIRRGLFPMTNAQGMAALASMVKRPYAHGLVLGMHWQSFAKTSPMSRAAPLFGDLVAAEENEGGLHDESPDTMRLRQRIEAEDDSDKRRALLVEGLQQLVADVMGLARDSLSAEDSFMSRGMDSMMAIEIRHRLEFELGIQVAVVDLLKGASARTLADAIGPEVLRTEQPTSAGVEDLARELQSMDEEELQALLDRIVET